MDSAIKPQQVKATRSTITVLKWKCPNCGITHNTCETNVEDINNCRGCGIGVQLVNRNIKRKGQS